MEENKDIETLKRLFKPAKDTKFFVIIADFEYNQIKSVEVDHSLINRETIQAGINGAVDRALEDHFHKKEDSE